MTENHELELGKIGTEAKELFAFSLESRLRNIAIYGAKGAGKSHFMLPFLANQQTEGDDEGATFIVHSRKTALLLYEMAARYNREVILVTAKEAVFFSPAYHDGAIRITPYDFTVSSVAVHGVVDFAQAMAEKKIIIIEMSVAENDRGVRATIQLLNDIQANMYKNSTETPHFVYIDNAEMYLEHISKLLQMGAEFGIGTVLFFQSRDYLSKSMPAMLALAEGNIRNHILMGDLVHEDNLYFERRLYGPVNESFVRRRSLREVIIETEIKNVHEVISVLNVQYLSENIMDEWTEEGKKGIEKLLNGTAYPGEYIPAPRQVVKSESPRNLEQNEVVPPVKKRGVRKKAPTAPPAASVKKRPSVEKVVLCESDYSDEEEE